MIQSSDIPLKFRELNQILGSNLRWKLFKDFKRGRARTCDLPSRHHGVILKEKL